MKKKLIRLTESDLHRIIKESVNRILSEEYDDTSLMDELVKFITTHRKWAEEEESEAFDIINSYRCDIDTASPRIYNEMRDLVDEFALDHNLPEEWVDEIDLNELWWELGE